MRRVGSIPLLITLAVVVGVPTTFLTRVASYLHLMTILSRTVQRNEATCPEAKLNDRATTGIQQYLARWPVGPLHTRRAVSQGIHRVLLLSLVSASALFCHWFSIEILLAGYKGVARRHSDEGIPHFD